MSVERIGLPTDKRWMKYEYSLPWVVQACSRCTNCKYVHPWRIKSHSFSTMCPSLDYYMYDAYSCQGRMDIGLALASGRLKLTEKVVESLYKCTLCGACDAMCKTQMDMEPLRVLKELREICVREGVAMPQHRAFAESIEKNHNPYLEPHEKRFAWMPSEVKPARKADVVYFVGCTTAYRRRGIARATVRILNAAGVEFAVLDPDEYCCGKPAHKMGFRNLANKMIEHNIETVNELGAKKLITSCPGCYNAFVMDADEVSDVGKNFEVLHSSQYIDTLISEGKLKFKKRLDLKVTYHDPCELARLAKPWKPGDTIGNVDNYEKPRKVLRRIPGLELVEMERIKEYAYCCGSDVGWAFSDFVLWTSRHRLEEAKATGAEAVVSCCPLCITNFKHVARGEIKVYDITECVQEAL